MITKRTLLFAFVSVTILTIGLLIFTSRGDEAQTLARSEPSYELPAQPSIQALVNAPDAEYTLASIEDAQALLTEMDDDVSQAFEAIEFGYATVVIGGECSIADSTLYCGDIVITANSVSFGELVFSRFKGGQENERK